MRRVWTVELRPRADGPSLVCPHCAARALPLQAGSARSAALEHLARHARAGVLAGHLRTCQCRAQGCGWHPRHRGCAGPVRLALTRHRGGRTWRLADTCAACAAATSNTAIVPDTLVGPGRPRPSRGVSAPPRHGPQLACCGRVRVREMLTYLAAALPGVASPASRLLALQCALRADVFARVRLPAGLLRCMRLRGRREVWEELADSGWLEMPDLKPARLEVRLHDAAILDQAPGRGERRRAAHWALSPLPMLLPPAAPPALRLTALALAAHSSPQVLHCIDMDALARLCGHTPHQTAELLDRLTRVRVLAAWHHRQDTDEVLWQLPDEHATPRAAVHPVQLRTRRP
ncbi:hypothetical protein ACIRH0_12785 [Streptomyces sp. NPDC093675]|uniref:hypothetical protein n=1 Tax=Streptomyces sp. NPDC093675 TaxID=3366049 RepID=UPI003818298A